MRASILAMSALILSTPLAPLPAQAAAPQPEAALLAAVHNPMRDAKFVARDTARHPAEELAFFGVRPNATLVEISPGGGYWTEILAPYLFAQGTYYVDISTDPDDIAPFKALLAQNRPTLRHLHVVTLAPPALTVAPPGSADVVLTFRNVHNWMDDGSVDQMFAAFYTALKHGGILGVEEHRGRTDQKQDPKAADGYVRQDYVIALAEKAGFKLAGSSEIDANPKDTKDYPKGVWTLPPSFTLGAQDHAKYAAIGEADNMVLKFLKP